MTRYLLPALTGLALWGCSLAPPLPRPDADPPGPRLDNIRQLTFDGDNGEAYFSWDDRELI
jgi:hypothetical protein